MDSIELQHLPRRRLVVFVASTTGDGEVPDNMSSVWKFLRQPSLPNDSLSSTEVAVLGLGDSSYEKFNAAARMLSVRLEQLGAKSMCPRGLADEQSEQGLEGDLDIWLKTQLWPALQKRCPVPPELLPISDQPAVAGTRYSVQRATAGTAVGPASGTPTTSPAHSSHHPVRAPRYFPAFLSAPGRAYKSSTTGALAPMLAQLESNERVTASGWSQDTRHLRFRLPKGAPRWQAGDVCVLWPRNDGDGGKRLRALWGRLGLRPDDTVVIREHADGGEAPDASHDGAAAAGTRHTVAKKEPTPAEVLDLLRRVYRNPALPSALDRHPSHRSSSASRENS